DPADADSDVDQRGLGIPQSARIGVRTLRDVVRTFRSAVPGRPKGLHYFLLGLFLTTTPAFAQDTHLLVIAGVGGDEDHVKAFNKYSLAIIDAAKKHGMADANIMYLGENPDQSGGRMKARATRDN